MPATGTCAKLSTLFVTADEKANEKTTGLIELLDVGRVEVASSGVPRAALEPRELPNLGDFIRGTFYALSNTNVTPGARYDVTVGGSNDFSALSISAFAPQELSDVAFDGVVATDSSITLTNQRMLRITWTPDAPSDLLYVDSTSNALHETTRCVFADTGLAQIPQPSGDHGQIEVHRLRRHFISTPMATELRFDFYRSFAFQREP